MPDHYLRRICRATTTSFDKINVIAATNEAFSRTIEVESFDSRTQTLARLRHNRFFFCIPTCQRTIVGAFAYHRLTCNHVLHNSRIVRINSRFPSQTRRITNDLKYHQHRTISQCSISFCVPSIFLTLLIYMDESTDYPVEESKISKDCPKNFQNMKSSANLTTAVSLVTL